MPICPTCNRNYPGASCVFCKWGSAPSKQPAFIKPVVVAAQQLAPNTLPVGASLVIQYSKKGVMQFSELNSATTFYLYIDMELDFKVMAKNITTAVDLNTTTWSGTSGSNGRGQSISVKFSALSLNTTLAGAKTVIATFGAHTVTINFIVFSLNAVLTPDDIFASRSLDNFGVDEKVQLSFTTNPAGITAVQAGGLKWEVVEGALDRNSTGLLLNPATHAMPVLNDGMAEYRAPCRTHAADMGPQATKMLTLKLKITSGLSENEGVKKRITINKPSAHMRPAPGQPNRHVNGMPSAGFYGEIFLTPKNVSFRTLRWREGAGNIVTSGTFGSTGWNGTPHTPTAFGHPVHGTITGGNVNTGCTVQQTDNVYTGANYAVPQFASDIEVVGTCQWPIIWEYTYEDLITHAWANDWITMQLAHHVATMYQSGRMTIFKGHIRCATQDCMLNPVSKRIDEPTVL